MPLDPDAFRSHLAPEKLSRQAEDEVIHRLETIMQSFVDQAFEASLEEIGIPHVVLQDSASANGPLGLISDEASLEMHRCFNRSASKDRKEVP